jgi:putative endonuclease
MRRMNTSLATFLVKNPMRIRPPFFRPYPYHVYIVKCSDGSFYTGITNDLERRLDQHNGLRWGGAKYTRGKGPVHLMYVEKFSTRSEAAKREWDIKHTLNREDKENLINGATKEDILNAI